ncbi:uncharacterized protein G2W53_028984 [Senna tora]|uniref:Uncharacterized protein n=1 Tax=Senna tora TaxID=362788 RepID=A0A834W9A6_9FABA|nr:uncharacterized protein G2W53_028984 [Senna tora]
MVEVGGWVGGGSVLVAEKGMERSVVWWGCYGGGGCGEEEEEAREREGTVLGREKEEGMLKK